MDGRPSLAAKAYATSTPLSTESLASGQGNGTISGFTVKTGSSWPPRSSDNMDAKTAIPDMDTNPDDLFVKYPVFEVKNIQQRLRADAEDKQEELRLMVGERYRELLQASTSIISIARSSKRVVDALQETKEAILSLELTKDPHRSHAAEKHDTELQTLQVLSAHVKLLLDAPEHLWRLMEQKKYFEAAWLFLLARVVHRALMRDDDEEQGWSTHDIDVLERFPLVQRQWEAVSQFRSQIVHKATLSLREYTITPEGTCATLLTLHLLDSKPLMETLSVLLAQRSKAFQHALSARIPHTNGISTASKSTFENGSVTALPSGSHLREIKQASRSALDVISATVRDVNIIFRKDGSQKPLIGQVVDHIQSAEYASIAHLPQELLLTTEALLSSLPSSTYFLLLPMELRSYRPYVDTSSTSSSVSQSVGRRKLDEWYEQTVEKLTGAAERWCKDISTAEDIWSLRMWLRKRIRRSKDLSSLEGARLLSVLDDVLRCRVSNIWSVALRSAGESWRENLSQSLFKIREGSELNPIDNVFREPPLIPPQAGVGSISDDPSIQKYRNDLQQRLVGRTPSLSDLLSVLEDVVVNLRRNMSSQTISQDDDSQTLVKQLGESLKPEIAALLSQVSGCLNSAVDEVSASAGRNVQALIFLKQIAEVLSTFSLSPSDTRFMETFAIEFQTDIKQICSRIVNSWRVEVVKRIIAEYAKATGSLTAKDHANSSPTSIMIQSVSSLASSTQQLVAFNDPVTRDSIVKETLFEFIAELIPTITAPAHQSLWDLALLHRLVEIWDKQALKLLSRLHDRIVDLKTQLALNGSCPDYDVSGYLAKIQILIAPLLPSSTAHLPPPQSGKKDEKLMTLLPYGIPTVEQAGDQLVIDIAKPAPRFGLLLVAQTIEP